MYEHTHVCMYKNIDREIHLCIFFSQCIYFRKRINSFSALLHLSDINPLRNFLPLSKPRIFFFLSRTYEGIPLNHNGQGRWHPYCTISVGAQVSNFSACIAPSCKTTFCFKRYEKFILPLDKSNQQTQCPTILQYFSINSLQRLKILLPFISVELCSD